METPTRIKAFYVFINSLLWSAPIYLGALSNSGGITRETFIYAAISSLIVFIVTFRNFWDTETQKILNEQNYISF